MGRRKPNKTKTVFKLPSEVQKGNIAIAYSTSQNVTIEGYTGTVKVITSKELPSDALPCRDVNGSGARAWVQLNN